jgi:hypothetical protein
MLLISEIISAIQEDSDVLSAPKNPCIGRDSPTMVGDSVRRDIGGRMKNCSVFYCGACSGILMAGLPGLLRFCVHIIKGNYYEKCT